MPKLANWVVGVILLSLSSVAAQAALIVDAGEVTGVTDINIDGELHTFDFIEGTFNSIFGGVGSTFDTLDAAEQIVSMFVGTPFENDPFSVEGCDDVPTIADVCLMLVHDGTPYFSGDLISIVAISSMSVPNFFSSPVSARIDTGAQPAVVFAVSRTNIFPATPVPEPSTMALLGLSLLGLGSNRRAQNKA